MSRKMSRKVSARVIAPLVLLVSATTSARAATPRLDAEKIRAALHTATPEEDGFVDRALAMVEEGKLSASLVQAMFVRARGEQQHKFQQFKYGLLGHVSDPAIRAELVNGQTPPPPPPNLGQRVAASLRRLSAFFSRVRSLLE